MIYVLIACIIGGIMPFQGAVNARLSTVLGSGTMAALVSFMFGTFALTIVNLAQGKLSQLKNITDATPLMLTGGLMGAIFVFSALYLIPKIGATSMMAAFITGQLALSLLIDHFGLLSLPVQPISAMRLAGVALLFAGVYLTTK
jgi:transporter family-2 protein